MKPAPVRRTDGAQHGVTQLCERRSLRRQRETRVSDQTRVRASDGLTGSPLPILDWSRTSGRHRSCLVMPEHSRQALPKEKEEADCADKQPDPTRHVSDERQKFDVVPTLRAVAVTGTIFEAGDEPPP